MKVNLHTHSIYSDGEETPEKVVELAAQAGVDLLVLTDHNTFRGYPRFKAACDAHGINFIRGVEIDCVQPEIDFQMELLAYFPNGGHRCLAKVLQHKQKARAQRVERAIVGAREHFGIPDLKIADLEEMAKVEKGFIGMLSNKLMYKYLQKRLGGTLASHGEVQREAYWKNLWRREELDNEYTLYELIPLIRKNGGFPVIPHFGFHFGAKPELMRAKSDEYLEHLKYMKSLGLWGLELHPYRYYPQQGEINEIVKSWAHKVGLHLTTGSDFHGGVVSTHRIFEWFGVDFQGFSND
ncbi:MAG: PHP domain-containing protein [Rikenellaceae bacterium]